MSLIQEVLERSGNQCELCASNDNLTVYNVAIIQSKNADESVNICATCKDQIENPDNMDANHWRCLNDSMWSEVPAVKVLSWRMLNRLKGEGWPVDLLEMMYLEDDVLAWARETGEGNDGSDAVVHKDSNGATLNSGDTVVLIKDLNVKGGGFTAKRGTAVRNISLVHDNAEHIEGRVEGQQIVILTQYVKKS
ncbi:PhnA protein [Vicingus serpentipes]|uniref:PhnA protein n=1 Tax=Vicingus serpentipes TaxID=1926625 RepID=A0A5C6RYC4_9FLAO|nr:alkylphosphonate utilization protein [Vicingus serpentipes]TXB67084.1 PhnA protein [Vicingus serpentipes]